jgi:hypothetical protein
MSAKKKPKEIGERSAMQFLVESGWKRCPQGWRHADLHWPWPTHQAVRYQREMSEPKKGNKSA